MSSPASFRSLLAGAIDYAGLFPPAKLGMHEAAQNFASYLAGEYSWALGRFIVPILRLEELVTCAKHLLPQSGNMTWRLSVLTGPDLETHASTITSFNERQKEGSATFVIEVIETKAATPAEARTAMNLTPPGLKVYFEVPLASDIPTWVDTLREIGAGAKVRTGGIREDMIPAPGQVARFIRECVNAQVPFKATAGLHHPIRAVYNLTYDADSPKGMMYGFLNVLIASAFAYVGMDNDDVLRILEEESSASFEFRSDGLTWRGHRLDTAALKRVRQNSILSFGSCSFDEPVVELRSLNLL